MLPENHQVGSTGRTQLLAPLLTSIKDHKHGLTLDEGDELLNLLCSCAWAPPCSSSNNEQTEDHFYLQAVERLKASQVWLQHETVQTWLNNYWLCIPKVILISTLLKRTCTYIHTYTPKDTHVQCHVTLAFTPSTTLCT